VHSGSVSESNGESHDDGVNSMTRRERREYGHERTSGVANGSSNLLFGVHCSLGAEPLCSIYATALCPLDLDFL
jgi:hypothetical protein